MTSAVTNDKCWVFYGLEQEITQLTTQVKLHNGIEYIAVDTDKRFLYDEENSTWLECKAKL